VHAPGDSQWSLDVVVVSWNNRDLTIDCLDHIQRNSVPARLIVVDNASDDDSPAAIRERFPAATVIELERNIGYGPAMNRGIAAGDAEFVALINNDANLDPDFLELTLAPFADPEVGITGGVSLNPATDLVDAAGILIDHGLAGYLYAAGESPDAVDVSDPRLIAPAHVHAVYRREAIDGVGGFDEEFFAYNEEVDLVMRVRSAGWKTRIVSAARSVHVGSASVGERTLRQIELASWGRGYLAGRYRVAVHWLLFEFAIAVVDSARLRSPAPVRQKVSGWRRGHKLPRRHPDPGIEYVGWREVLRLRFGAYRRTPSSA
jgi:GT2 family glycosyltransferase